MSMASLLGCFGLNTLRYITSTGEVIFDGVTPSLAVAGGAVTYTHKTHGTVMPVEPHSFHGGEERQDSIDNATWWSTNQDELQRHIDAMATFFPGFIHVPATADLAPTWLGQINTGRGTFEIAIMLRRDRGLPAVVPIGKKKFGRSVNGRWVQSPHLYLSGNLCVAGGDDWNPDVHTAATATGWAAHWLAAYTEWFITGRGWPVEGVAQSAS
ncbi:MAG: hypothetical protein M3306_26645 [Actinomycetota bacterium]|nr:hypothetical protein [Actinomycetota bacterium]